LIKRHSLSISEPGPSAIPRHRHQTACARTREGPGACCFASSGTAQQQQPSKAAAAQGGGGRHARSTPETATVRPLDRASPSPGVWPRSLRHALPAGPVRVVLSRAPAAARVPLPLARCLTFLLSLLSPIPPVSPTLYFSILLVLSPSLSPLSSLAFQARKKSEGGSGWERERDGGGEREEGEERKRER